MHKQEFLEQLGQALSGLPEQDRKERLAFYGEMIDDRLEEGIPEEEAVSGIGTPGEIAAQVIDETPLPRIVREKVRSGRHRSGGEILLLILGFPLWFPLLIAAFAVIFSSYSRSGRWSCLCGPWILPSFSVRQPA